MVDPLRTEYTPPQFPVQTEHPGEKQHTVQEGENLQQIADDHRTTPEAVLEINPQVRDPDLLSTGDVLNMPDPTVDPAVSRTVDAVLSPDATAQQKNEANVRLQDYVDSNGGLGGPGVARETLPSEAVQLLSDAGLPTVPKEVVTAVDQVIGPDASFDQRIAGYKAVAGYVDQVGGVSDQGITAEALPAQASQMLREAGTDVRLRPEVITAVNALLKDGATPADRDAAYATVQRYVDQVGGVGDAGIVAEALPLKAAHLLADANNPALRFDPRVIEAVDRVIAPGATDAQQIAGYDDLQQYVDQVGGISDQGITADYLPARAAELLRESGTEVSLEAAPNASADDIVQIMEAGATPAEQVRILGEAYAKADPQTQQALLANSQVQQAIRSAAADATKPLGEPPRDGAGQAVPFLDAANNLDALTKDLPPTLVGKILEAAAPAYMNYALSDSGGMSGIEGSATFLKVLDRAAGTPEGDAAFRALSESVSLDRNGIFQHLSSGGSPAYLAAAGYDKDMIVEGVTSFANTTLNDKVTAYIKETEELNWLVANHGGSMTPEQLQKVIDDYIASKGPGWQEKLEGMQEDIAQQGIQLQNQIDALQQAGGYDDTIKGLLDDPENQLALSTALGRHPDIATDSRLRDYALYAKVSEGGRKLLGEVANSYVKANVLPDLQGANPADPASMQRAEAALARLNNSALATAYGVDKAKLQQAVDELKGTLPKVGDTPEAANARLSQFNKTLEGVKGFEKSTGAGQLFRALGVATTTFSFLNSTNRAFNEPGAYANWLKAGADTFGLAQKTADFLVARGADGTVTKALGGALAGKIATGLTAVADFALGLKAASEGDYATAALWGVSAVGGGLSLAAAAGAGWAGSWAGPVGIALVALAAVGIGLVAKVNESNKHDNETSAAFLQHAGFDQEAADALVDQSGDGHSPVPLLEKYAELKGYDLTDPAQRQTFVDWVNDMPLDRLEHLRNWAHHTLDDFGGDVGKFGSDTTVHIPTTWTRTVPPAEVWEHGPYTVGEFDAFVQEYGGTPLPHA